MKFSVVIPTYKREEELAKCLNSIVKQKKLPEEVVLIDDDELSGYFLDKHKKSFENANIDLRCYKKNQQKEKRGSSTSRNIGLSLAKNDIVFIFDDDLILEEGFFQGIIKVWEENKNENLLGVGGVITNNRKKTRIEKLYNKIFGLDSEFSWDVNKACFQAWDDNIKKREKGFYVHGGVCSYDKKKAQKLGFTVFGGGREALEDVDFCLRAKKNNYFFIIEPEARVFHDHESTGKEDKFDSAQKESRNRKKIFKTNCSQSLKNKLYFTWGSIGWILRQFLSGNFKKAWGLSRGLIK